MLRISPHICFLVKNTNKILEAFSHNHYVGMTNDLYPLIFITNDISSVAVVPSLFAST